MLPSPFRSRLRAFQAMRCDPPDPGFIADLEFLENRDLDLSIRSGAMLAFNALLITIGTHPVSASPGAPLSVDAASQPWLTLASLAGIATGDDMVPSPDIEMSEDGYPMWVTRLAPSDDRE